METILIIICSVMYTAAACFCAATYVLSADYLGMSKWFALLMGIFWPISLLVGIIGAIIIWAHDNFGGQNK
jgi:uncharacterized protein YxeA